MATGCQVQVTITAGNYTLKQRATCTSGAFTSTDFTDKVYNPGNPDNDYTKAAPTGLTMSPAIADIQWTWPGQRWHTPTTITLTGTSDTRSITVVAETGFVY